MVRLIYFLIVLGLLIGLVWALGYVADYFNKRSKRKK